MGSGSGSSGHYKDLLTFANQDQYNLNKVIEPFYSATNKDDLSNKINTARGNCEYMVFPIGEPSGNWSGSFYIYLSSENNWILETESF